MSHILAVESGNIVTYACDAVVNAANTSLLGGGGVDGAIHRAAGPRLLEACRAIGGCAVGEAVITPGFDLPARYVIHTVGPVWHGGGRGEAERLAACHGNALELARAHGLRTIAFPAISTGVYRYPVDQAAGVAAASVAATIARHPDAFDRIVFVCFGAATHRAFAAAVEQIAR